MNKYILTYLIIKAAILFFIFCRMVFWVILFAGSHERFKKGKEPLQKYMSYTKTMERSVVLFLTTCMLEGLLLYMLYRAGVFSLK